MQENQVTRIFSSNRFKDVMYQFRNDSKVAMMLVDTYLPSTELVDNPINYISVSDSDPNKISYLSPDRVKQISKSNDDYWTSSKRFHCKPGAFITKLFKNVTPKEVETFSTLYKNFANKKDFTFEILKGNDIATYYHQNSYDTNSGSLGASCMKYDKCQKFLNLYIDNQDLVSLLIMRSNNSKALIGRALIWNIDGQKVLDRIYTVQDDKYAAYFKKWAEENDCLYKTHQNWSNTLQFNSEKEKNKEYKFSIKLQKFEYGYYPYLDTFKWFNVKSGHLFNFKDSKDCLVLSNANGGMEQNSYLEFDDINRDWSYSGSLVYLEDHKIMTRAENLNYSETLNKYILKSESNFNEELKDYMYIDLSKGDSKLIEERREFITKMNSKKKIRQWEATSGSSMHEIAGSFMDMYDMYTIRGGISRYSGTIQPTEQPAVAVDSTDIEQPSQEVEYVQFNTTIRPSRDLVENGEMSLDEVEVDE